eukprot:1140250-Pelagomonas_calceolata.AAC.11
MAENASLFCDPQGVGPYHPCFLLCPTVPCIKLSLLTELLLWIYWQQGQQQKTQTQHACLVLQMLIRRNITKCTVRCLQETHKKQKVQNQRYSIRKRAFSCIGAGPSHLLVGCVEWLIHLRFSASPLASLAASLAAVTVAAGRPSTPICTFCLAASSAAPTLLSLFNNLVLQRDAQARKSLCTSHTACMISHTALMIFYSARMISCPQQRCPRHAAALCHSCLANRCMGEYMHTGTCLCSAHTGTDELCRN